MLAEGFRFFYIGEIAYVFRVVFGFWDLLLSVCFEFFGGLVVGDEVFSVAFC